MTTYDVILIDLGRALADVDRRPAAGFYAACGTAFKNSFLSWAGGPDAEDVRLLDRALDSGIDYATGGRQSGLPHLLERLERRAPHGEAVGGISPQVAQDCWICVDTAIRIAVDCTFNWGPVVEYVLEPMMFATTQQLYGVSQLGSGPGEEALTRTVLEHGNMRGALAFCRWAINSMQGASALSVRDIQAMSRRAAALVPSRSRDQ